MVCSESGGFQRDAVSGPYGMDAYRFLVAYSISLNFEQFSRRFRRGVRKNVYLRKA